MKCIENVRFYFLSEKRVHTKQQYIKLTTLWSKYASNLIPVRYFKVDINGIILIA